MLSVWLFERLVLLAAKPHRLQMGGLLRCRCWKGSAKRRLVAAATLQIMMLSVWQHWLPSQGLSIWDATCMTKDLDEQVHTYTCMANSEIASRRTLAGAAFLRTLNIPHVND